MTIGGFIRPCIVRWGVLVPEPVEFYIISDPKRTCRQKFTRKQMMMLGGTVKGTEDSIGRVNCPTLSSVSRIVSDPHRAG